MPKTAPLDVRFWAKVDQAGGSSACWLWKGSKTPQGYGKLYIGKRPGRVLRPATHVSWLLHKHEQVPDGLCILHRCDNPPCVNPAHLFLGTHADNMADKTAKGRWRRDTSYVGEANPKAILTEGDVRLIRVMRAAGARRVDLAARFGVSDAAIGDIVKRRAWRHVA